MTNSDIVGLALALIPPEHHPYRPYDCIQQGVRIYSGVSVPRPIHIGEAVSRKRIW